MTDMHEYVKSICLGAREASRSLALLSGKERNAALEAIAAALDAESAAILEENAADLAAGRESGLSAAMLDRLALTPERIGGICSALRCITVRCPSPTRRRSAFSKPSDRSCLPSCRSFRSEQSWTRPVANSSRSLSIRWTAWRRRWRTCSRK